MFYFLVALSGSISLYIGQAVLYNSGLQQLEWLDCLMRSNAISVSSLTPGCEKNPLSWTLGFMIKSLYSLKGSPRINLMSAVRIPSLCILAGLEGDDRCFFRSMKMYDTPSRTSCTP